MIDDIDLRMICDGKKSSMKTTVSVVQFDSGTTVSLYLNGWIDHRFENHCSNTIIFKSRKSTDPTDQRLCPPLDLDNFQFPKILDIENDANPAYDVLSSVRALYNVAAMKCILCNYNIKHSDVITSRRLWVGRSRSSHEGV